MNRIISALQFLTILPIGTHSKTDTRLMTQFFPMAGLIIGVLVSIFDRIALFLWQKPVVSLLDVVFLVVITGALHLDGLGDAADGLLGHRTKDEALSIMKDSRIGVMGLAAIVCVLLIKWGGIMGLDHHRSLLLIIIPAYARSSMLFGIKFLKYGRAFGTASLHFNYTFRLTDFWGLTIPVFLSLFLGLRAILLSLFFIILTAAIIWYYKKRIGCITGDMLGAMAEIEEAFLFLLVSIGNSV